MPGLLSVAPGRRPEFPLKWPTQSMLSQQLQIVPASHPWLLIAPALVVSYDMSC